MFNRAAVDLESINRQLEESSPSEILVWSRQAFGPSIAATSSFQTQSLPMLHMIAAATPDMPILFLDTGFHFPDTLAYRDRLMAEWGLDVRSLTAKIGHEQFVVQYGQLYRTNPDHCCYVNKVLPLQEARTVWQPGLRESAAIKRRLDAIHPSFRGPRADSTRFARWHDGQSEMSGAISISTTCRFTPCSVKAI